MSNRALLALAASSRARSAITAMPPTRALVNRFVAGEGIDDAITVVRALSDAGLRVSLDHLGEDCTDADVAAQAAREGIALLDRLAAEGLTGIAEVSVKLSALGLSLDRSMALDHARKMCEAAARAGTTITLDMEDHRSTDATLSVLRELRPAFDFVGAVLQAYLHRTEGDCRDLADAGSRVRLCKGAYAEPSSVAFTDKHAVDASYARCLGVLMAGAGYPMIATHDPAMITLANQLAAEFDRVPSTYEFQMLHGIRPTEQRRIADAGQTLRVYVPYGVEWYGYLVRRMAERPANLAVFLRSLATVR